MIYPSRDEMEKHVDSKYSLVVAVSKRAKQLKEGAPKLIETKSTNPITVALEEIAAGKLQIVKPSLEELEAQQRAHAAALDARNSTARLGIPTLADLEEEDDLIVDEASLEEAEAAEEDLSSAEEDASEEETLSDDEEESDDTELISDDQEDAGDL